MLRGNLTKNLGFNPPPCHIREQGTDGIISREPHHVRIPSRRRDEASFSGCGNLIRNLLPNQIVWTVILEQRRLVAVMVAGT